MIYKHFPKKLKVSFALVILLVKVCDRPHLKQVAICADNNADETILSIKLNAPETIAPIPTAISWFCKFDIASVFVLTSPCKVDKAVVVAYFTSQKPVVTIWSVFETTPVEYPDSIQSVIWFLLVK